MHVKGLRVTGRTTRNALSPEEAVRVLDDIEGISPESNNPDPTRFRSDVETLMMACLLKEGYAEFVDRIIRLRTRMGWYLTDGEGEGHMVHEGRTEE